MALELKISDWLPTLRDIIQIIFFVTASTVTILTYRRARRTLLQPIRAEVFKKQLEETSKVLALVAGKEEMELRREAGIEKLFSANCLKLFDEYAMEVFGLELKEPDKRPYRKFKSSRIRVEDLTKHFTLADGYKRSKNEEDPHASSFNWSEYSYIEVHLPLRFVKFSEQLKKAAQAPLLPSGCAELIMEMLDDLEKNITILQDTLTECAREMPRKYPTVRDLEQASFDWVWNRYNNKLLSLEARATAISSFVREYFHVDSVMVDKDFRPVSPAVPRKEPHEDSSRQQAA